MATATSSCGRTETAAIASSWLRLPAAHGHCNQQLRPNRNGSNCKQLAATACGAWPLQPAAAAEQKRQQLQAAGCDCLRRMATATSSCGRTETAAIASSWLRLPAAHGHCNQQLRPNRNGGNCKQLAATACGAWPL